MKLKGDDAIRKFYGDIPIESPTELLYYKRWPEYGTQALIPPSFNPEIVGENLKGMRWGFWPFYFEEYVSDSEPDLSKSDPAGTARFRTIQWQRFNRTDVPRGWWLFSKKISRLEGIVELMPEKKVESNWSDSARRYRNKWHREHLDKTHVIEMVNLVEFESAYLQSKVAKNIGTSEINQLRRQSELPSTRPHISLWAAKNKQNGTIVAGLATITSQSKSGSYYQCGFYLQEAALSHAMIGLMDHWMSTLKKDGIRFAHLGNFWIPGKPRGWKGFSKFKAKLGPRYIAYGPMLTRFKGGKLF